MADNEPGLPNLRTVTVSSEAILVDIKNVDRIDGKRFDSSFNWLTPFEVGGVVVLTIEKAGADFEKLRRRLLIALGNSRLSKDVFLKLAKLTEEDRKERAAWILESGELGPVRIGNVMMVLPAAKPQGRVVGFVHTHPTLPFELAPPSRQDYDSSLRDYPIQFVVESSKGRVWAQYLPSYTSLLGRITAGSFQPLSDEDPLAKIVYKVINLEAWRMMEDEKAKKDLEQERERLRQRLLQQQKAKGTHS